MEDGWLVKDEEVDATLFSLQEIKATPSAVLKTIRVGTLMEAISFDDDDQVYDWFNCIVTSKYRKNKGVQICFVDETNQPEGKKEWTTRIQVRDDLVEQEEVEEEEDEDEEEVDYSSWKCTELRKELKARDLNTKGRKAELVSRLDENDSK